MMSVLIIIPARLASTRLPDKPLARIGGIPMVVCVAQAASAAACGEPVIAAAEEKIVSVVKGHNIRAVLTDPALPSGSDRVRAAADLIDPTGKAKIVVNVQGDMPELAPIHVQAVIAALKADPKADIATLAFQSINANERGDENVVKAILADTPEDGPRQALAFARALPSSTTDAFWHHIGIYAYRRAALERFCDLPPSPREKHERLEQWRALEAGMKMICAIVQTDCPGIDSPEDLARIRALREGGTAS
jgi:3-deoxy-manno-octulosonate cytidylyltransferase (CMP-KDO synthetase)